ncbi:hypothetical protein TRFO_17323 [Tritrichomonas foetus]|uniref:Uncharacterized protein n=1 Tax=Tritrichomonas foetus TaxID=1144522 RepID=A0A1J4KNF6_9EUKA|nr:hypothetical protein TRFO_17323 [Tritrichomonas foetus]|eukprot:OHT12771.1 hypothetical protein TRFO_17323 [Tritrichomonas foetus]
MDLSRKLTFKEKKRYLEERHPTRNFRYVPKNLAVFGQDGKAITIGCSRKPPPPPEEVPGPGAYEIDPKTLHLDIPHTIQKRPETDYSTMTSEFEFLPLEPFTRPKTTIHNRDNIRFFTVNDVPPPTYLPPSPTPCSPTIGNRVVFRNIDEENPGPGQYSPIDCNRPKSAVFTIPKTPERDVWSLNLEAPGPGQYNTTPQLKKPKRWAGKLRVQPKNAIQRKSLKDEIKSMC